MFSGTRKVAALFMLVALMAVGLASCGSGDDTTTAAPRPAVSRETADHLAKLSNRVASDLDAGETCTAAYDADELKSAVEDSDLPANLRPGVVQVADDLVNQVNCPPPPPPPEPEEEPKKPKEEHGNGDDHGDGNDEESKPGHSDHGSFVPPGQAKIKGEEG